MKQPEEEKPARIRIENRMQHGLSVPLPGPGRSIRGFVRIPAATTTPEGEKLGMVETDQLDAVTVNRLRYHYEWRPSDVKNIGKKRDELTQEQVVEIGLLKITILKDTDGGKLEVKDPKSKAA